MGEEVRDILTALEVYEEIGNLEEEQLDILEEIAEALVRKQKDKLPALRGVPKKNLLEETAKVDKVLCKIKTHSITKTNGLFYARAVVGTDGLELKINKAAKRKNQRREGRYKIKLKS